MDKLNLRTQTLMANPKESLFLQISKSLNKRHPNGAVWIDRPFNLYLSEIQSETYLKLMNDSAYTSEFHNPVRDLIKRHSSDLLKGIKSPVDLIDLGPGYPDKTFPILDNLKKRNIDCLYKPVDISRDFLDIAFKAVSQFGILVKPFHTLFEELPKLERKNNLFRPDAYRVVLIGLTVMNYRLPEILKILSKLTVKKGIAIMAFETRKKSIDELLKPYRSAGSELLNFLVIKHLGIKSKDVSFLVRFKRNRIEMGFKVKRNLLIGNIHIPKGVIIITAISYRHTISEFQKKIKGIFDSIETFTNDDHSVVLIKTGNTE